MAKSKTYFQDHILEIKRLFEDKLISQKSIHSELKILYDESESNLKMKIEECNQNWIKLEKLSQNHNNEENKFSQKMHIEK